MAFIQNLTPQNHGRLTITGPLFCSFYQVIQHLLPGDSNITPGSGDQRGANEFEEILGTARAAVHRARCGAINGTQVHSKHSMSGNMLPTLRWLFFFGSGSQSQVVNIYIYIYTVPPIDQRSWQTTSESGGLIRFGRFVVRQDASSMPGARGSERSLWRCL